MENTYTYTARNIEDPEQVVTLTLQDHHMSVGLGAPLEQIETVLEHLKSSSGLKEVLLVALDTREFKPFENWLGKGA